jgi:hypothetical protein
MPIKNKDSKDKNGLRKGKQTHVSDSDSHSHSSCSSDESSDEEYIPEEEDGYETIDSDDEDEDKDDKKKKEKKQKHNKLKSKSKKEEEEEDVLNQKKFRKMLYKTFPSRYLKNKNKFLDEIEKSHLDTDTDTDTDSDTDSSISEISKTESKKRKSRLLSKSKSKSKTKSSKQNKLKSKKHESEQSESDSDNDDENEEPGKDFSIFFTTFGDDNDEDENIDRVLNDENEECNSDDEKTFMKERYETISKCEDEEQKYSSSKKTSNKKKKVKSIDVDGEYLDLLELKKHLLEKLEKKPNSKILIKALKDCKDAINELVKKSRSKNTKDYYKLIQSHQDNMCEVSYFKTKLSNKEQLTIMKQLEEVNNHILIDKPYRILLLQSKMPIKYKATVMQKLNTMESMESGDPEYYKLKSWVDAFMRVPFDVYKSLSVKMSDGPEACGAYMRNAKQILDDCVYGLETAKLQTLQMIGQWITNPAAMGTAIAITGEKGTGKCHAIDTPILMFDGSIKMVQDVVVGDVIMGDDSTRRNILGLGQGQDEMYDIVSSNGETYRVNSEHILSLKVSEINYIVTHRREDGTLGYNVCLFNLNNYKTFEIFYHTLEEAKEVFEEHSTNGKIVDITVKDYLELPKNVQQGLLGYKTGVEFAHKPNVFNPYVIGVWLGDTTNEYKRDDESLQNLNSFLTTLKHYDLLNVKYIPDDYKINSRSVRLQFLSGILDTDTCIETADGYEIRSKNKRLVDDILFLVRSLGIYVTQSEMEKSYTYDDGVRSQTWYCLNISGNGLDEIPTLCPRKNAICKNGALDLLQSNIRVVSAGRGDYYGFEIDGNRRFLLGSFTVTHNTSLVKDGISKILGREFAFIALGGAGDSSFLEGHSYTYEGSLWGKIVQILMDSKCMNPVIYFDELDKISDSPRGQEIASVLTHLTDTSQNSQFHDKYFSEIDFDLSKCLFIFSYNDESKVSPILKDRMYRIQTKGYDTKEKIIIAKKYILPKIREQVNFDESQVIIPDDTISYLVMDTKFTQNEEGVRNLKRCLEIIHTKLNLFRLVDQSADKFLTAQINLNVTFPYTVTRSCVDILIKNDEKQNHSLLAMYM